MSLAERTINSLFKTLREEGEIHEVWSIRMSFDKRDKLIPESIVLNEGYTGEENPSYETVEKKFKNAFAAAAGKTRMKGFVAKTGAPFITIIQNDFFKVNFNIPFGKGKMLESFPGDTDIDTYMLDGIQYVFTVALAKLSRPYTAVEFSNPVLQENINRQVDELRAVGLKPEDFAIESLFLDFENANFVADSANTINPNPDLELEPWLDFQKQLQLYFKTLLAKEENPYVLGYGVTVPVLEKRNAAVFEPVSLNFSTSFVPAKDKNGNVIKNKNGVVNGDPLKSSLNYLMMITRTPETDGTAGVMNSLLENYNVLGIDYELFYAKYLEDVFQMILKQLNETLISLNKSENNKSGGVFVSSRGNQTIKTNGAFVLKKNKMQVGFGLAWVNVSSSYSSTTPSTASHPPITTNYLWAKEIAINPFADILFPMYMITDDSMERMRQSGVPADIVAKLVSLDSRPFDSETDFVNTLRLKLSDNELKQNKEQILAAAAKPGRLVISLCFNELINYKRKSTGINETAETQVKGAGLYINLYPGKNGDMLIHVIPHPNGIETITKGSYKTVDDVNKVISGSFYSDLYAPVFLEKLTTNLKNGIKTLPEVVLPISNVYLYKTIGFVPGDGKNSVITFQSTYGPVYSYTI